VSDARTKTVDPNTLLSALHDRGSAYRTLYAFYGSEGIARQRFLNYQGRRRAVAEYIGLPPIQVYEVASFYSMFETKPAGRVHVSVCTNISCMLCGSDRIVAAVEKHLGIRTGESTPDGKFFLKREEECLAACNNAPMMMVDHVYYENLTPESAIKVLDGVK